MKTNKRFLKFLSLAVVSASLSVSSFGCTTITNENGSSIEDSSNVDNGQNNDSNSSDSNQDDSDNTPNNPGDSSDSSQMLNGTISNSILEKSTLKESDILEVKSNSFNLKENINDFLSLHNFSSYVGLKNNFENDIALFIYETWIKNNKNVHISNFVLEIDSIDENIILKSSKLTFNFSFIIKGVENTKFNILNNSISVDKDELFKIEVSSFNQTILPNIVSYNGKNYLGWMLNDVQVTVDDNTWNSQFCPISYNGSHLFKKKFSNLTTKKSFLTLYNEHQNKLSSLSIPEIKTSVQTNAHDNFVVLTDVINNSIDLLGLIIENPTLYSLENNYINNIIDLFSTSKLIPQSLKSFLKENAKSDVPFSELISKHKNELLGLMDIDYNNKENIIVQLFDSIKSNITELDKNNLEVVSKLFPSEIQNLIKIFFIDSNNQSFKDIIFNNIDEIFDILDSYNSNNNDAMKSLKGVLKTTFKDRSSDTFKYVFDVLLSDNSSKTDLINLVTSIFSISPQISRILDILIVKNNNFNSENFIIAIKEVYNLAKQVFLRKSTYESFWKGYENIEFLGTWVRNPYIDKTKMEVTFKYEIKMWFKNPIVFDVTKIKNLISDDTLVEIMKEYNIDISSFVPEIYFGTIKDYILDFVPDKITIGAGKGMNFFTFSAENQKMYFTPISNLNYYETGYQFIYNLNIWFQDESFIKSFTDYYRPICNDINLSQFGIRMQLFYATFWKSIIQNVFLRDYDVSLRMTLKMEDSDLTISNTEYESNLYISGFEFKTNKNNVNQNNIDQIWVQSSKNEVLAYTPDFRDYINNIYWKGQGYKEYLPGYKPYIDLDSKNRILDNILTITNSSINQMNLYSSFHINPIFNFDATLQAYFEISNSSNNFSITLKTRSFDINVYFPFYFYDIDNQKLTNNLHISKSVTWIQQNPNIVIN